MALLLFFTFSRLHGHGTITFPSGQIFEAEWVHGKSRGEGTARGVLTFNDGLQFGEVDYDYCDQDDRRCDVHTHPSLFRSQYALHPIRAPPPTRTVWMVDGGIIHAVTRTRTTFFSLSLCVLCTLLVGTECWAGGALARSHPTIGSLCRSRRFHSERVNGLNPAGLTMATNDNNPATIPEGTYDVGDGYYSTEANMIYS